mgnify:CR=1 FL=1
MATSLNIIRDALSTLESELVITRNKIAARGRLEPRTFNLIEGHIFVSKQKLDQINEIQNLIDSNRLYEAKSNVDSIKNFFATARSDLYRLQEFASNKTGIELAKN